MKVMEHVKVSNPVNITAMGVVRIQLWQERVRIVTIYNNWYITNVRILTRTMHNVWTDKLIGIVKHLHYITGKKVTKPLMLTEPLLST